MAILSLTSAKGAPGVTTTALALTLLWPHPVLLLEADPSGGSIMAGYFRGERPQDRGLIDLPAAHRTHRLEEGIWEAALQLAPSSDTGAVRWVVPGLTKPTQSGTMAPLWGSIATSLRAISSSGIDVIVDTGRITTNTVPLIRSADHTLLVSRTDLPAMAAARGCAVMLNETPDSAAATSLILVGHKQPHTRQEMSQRVGLPVAATMKWDPRAAAVFSHGDKPPPPGRFRRRSTAAQWARSPFVKTARAAAEELTDLLAQAAPASQAGGVVRA